LWRTPLGTDGEKSGHGNLPHQVKSHIPTPTASDHIIRKSTQIKPGSMHSVGLSGYVGMWPTPDATPRGATPNFTGKRPSGQKESFNLQTAVKMWPTPSATDHKGSGKTGKLRDRLDYAVERSGTKSKTYPTPQSRDYRTGEGQRWENPDRSRNLNDRIATEGNGGSLNPQWVEWLMGYPSGWTDLNVSETPSSRKSSRKSDTPSSKRRK
jgi:hypothetical protein